LAVGGYDGMHVIYEALKETNGSTDSDALMAAMKGLAWESPRGPMSIDPPTRDVVHNIYRSSRWTASSTMSSSRPSKR
jgi:branched-chain amino acid transport system substrate-binding protein